MRPGQVLISLSSIYRIVATDVLFRAEKNLALCLALMKNSTKGVCFCFYHRSSYSRRQGLHPTHWRKSWLVTRAGAAALSDGWRAAGADSG